MNKPSTAATTFRTAPVQMTDTGTGSYTSSKNAAKQVGNAVTNKAHTGYAGNTAETSGTSHNSGSFAESPSVSSVGNGRGFGCSRTINALGAGDYEGIGEAIDITRDLLQYPYDYAYNTYRNLLYGEPFTINNTGGFIVHQIVQAGKIAMDIGATKLLLALTIKSAAAVPATGGASTILAVIFLESAADAGITLTQDMASFLEDIMIYTQNGEITVDYREEALQSIDQIKNAVEVFTESFGG